MSEQEFVKTLSEIGVNINEEQLNLFRVYASFLLEYNTHTNLTAIKNVEDVYLKHFFDSLLGVKYFDFRKKSILDIGSGAGFPGVPLKIMFPDIKLTLLDSNGKKTRFLEELSSKLKIDFEVINDRAEKYILDRREQYDVVVSRAVSAMPVLAELCIPFVKINGHFVAYKGNLDETLENGKFAIETLGGKVISVKNDFLPLENAGRSFVIIEKKCKTESQYPRVFDKINKKPLQKS